MCHHLLKFVNYNLGLEFFSGKMLFPFLGRIGVDPMTRTSLYFNETAQLPLIFARAWLALLPSYMWRCGWNCIVYKQEYFPIE